MTTNTNKTPAEILALNQFLSDYPQELTFSEIMDLMESESDSVTVWQPFEYWPPLDVFAEIDNLRDNAERLTKPARTPEQAEIMRELLEGKKAEILNYDMGEEWAQSTLDAIQNELDNLSK